MKVATGLLVDLTAAVGKKTTFAEVAAQNCERFTWLHPKHNRAPAANKLLAKTVGHLAGNE